MIDRKKTTLKALDLMNSVLRQTKTFNAFLVCRWTERDDCTSDSSCQECESKKWRNFKFLSSEPPNEIQMFRRERRKCENKFWFNHLQNRCVLNLFLELQTYSLLNVFTWNWFREGKVRVQCMNITKCQLHFQITFEMKFLVNIINVRVIMSKVNGMITRCRRTVWSRKLMKTIPHPCKLQREVVPNVLLQ